MEREERAVLLRSKVQMWMRFMGGHRSRVPAQCKNKKRTHRMCIVTLSELIYLLKLTLPLSRYGQLF